MSTKRTDFVIFILSHGRADNVRTYNTLMKENCSYPIKIVIDDEDKQRERYIKNFGAENVCIFSKSEIAETFDEILKGDRRTVVYARNVCFKLAKELGFRYFLELDDDYCLFDFMFDENNVFIRNRDKHVREFDNICNIVLEYYENAKQITTIAFCQGGDVIGGKDNAYAQEIKTKRKAMNSFFCDVEREFKFIGRINEDVNAYTSLQHKGAVFLQIYNIQLCQERTQQNSGGMTDVYLNSGTYYKSFFSVICCPSAVKVINLPTAHMRLHHKIMFDKCCAKIISEKYKK